MSWCKVCGAYMFDSAKHRCPPIWLVKDEEYLGDDLRKVRGWDAEEAAAKYAEEWDQDEPELHDGGLTTHEVFVASSPDGPWKKFRLWGEATINYHADEVTEP